MKPTTLESLLIQTERSGDCLLWTGRLNEKGYGRIWYQGRQIRTHRLIYELVTGSPIPTGAEVMHTCDNRPCLEFSHLILGTHQQNISDCVMKGRQAKGERKPAAKLTEATVRDMRRLWRTSGLAWAHLGTLYGVAAPTAKKACLRLSWRHVD